MIHIFSLSKIQKKTYTIAFTPRQYLSHIDLNLGCPPISQTLMVTFPLVTFRILNPTVGIMSSLKLPDCKRMKKMKKGKINKIFDFNSVQLTLMKVLFFSSFSQSKYTPLYESFDCVFFVFG